MQHFNYKTNTIQIRATNTFQAIPSATTSTPSHLLRSNPYIVRHNNNKFVNIQILSSMMNNMDNNKFQMNMNLWEGSDHDCQ